MNIVQYHKKFREVAIKRNMDKKQKFILDETKAQKKFDYLNNDVQQEAFDERFKRANSDLAEAFQKFADALKKMRKVRFEEGGKRAGKTERQQQRAEQFKKWYGIDYGVKDIFVDVSGKYDLWKVKHRDEWVKEQQDEWYKIHGYKPYGPNFERMYGETFTEIDLQKLYLQQRWS